VSDNRFHAADEAQDQQQDASLAPTSENQDSGEIERLRERLTYYESFDRLIQENIARSGDLMREALDLRERTQAELARDREELERSRDEAERRFEAERQSQRAVFGSLMNELSTVRESAERLSLRVSEAVEHIGNDLPALGSSGMNESRPRPSDTSGIAGLSAIDPFRSSPDAQPVAETQDEPTDSGSVPFVSEADDAPSEPTSDEETVIALPAAEAMGSSGDEADPFQMEQVDERVTPFEWSDVAPVNEPGSEEQEPAPSLEEVLARFGAEASETSDETSQGTDDAQAAASSQFDDVISELTGAEHDGGDRVSNGEAISPTSDSGGAGETDASTRDDGEQIDPPDTSRAVTVLVHGVPRAATALSLQRHLANLDHISGVEAREYAEGVLRLQVTSIRPLEFSDLESWEDGQGIEPVHVHADVVEVRLPGADF
jgi:hypothetical protein